MKVFKINLSPDNQIEYKDPAIIVAENKERALEYLQKQLYDSRLEDLTEIQIDHEHLYHLS